MTDRDAILARRGRFIAIALAGGTVASTASCALCLQPLDSAQPVDAPFETRDAPPPDAGAAPTLDAASIDADGTDAAR